MSSQTLDQRRAKHAWETVAAIKGHKGDKEFKRQAKKLPVRIVTSGLGPSLAFLRAKNEALRPDWLDDALGRWVLQERGLRCADAKAAEGADLLKCAVYGDADFLRLATQEALAWLQWLNRFAEAEIEGDSVEG